MRLGFAQLNPTVGDFTANARKILAAYQQLVDSGEGFEKGTRNVLQGLGKPDDFKPGIHGVLASFIAVWAFGLVRRSRRETIKLYVACVVIYLVLIAYVGW